MSASTAHRSDCAWEKEQAPRISRRRLTVAAAIYCLWLIFLAVLSAIRWFGALQ